MYDVDFINIQTNKQPYSAVISSYDCEINSYNCGTILFEKGSVRLLNNGYEYNDSIYFSGFLYGMGLKSVSFKNVTFDHNMVYKGKAVDIHTYSNIGNFIYIENFLDFTLMNTTTDSNFIDTFVTLRMLASYNRTINSSSQLTDFNMLHVNITSNVFSHNFGNLLRFEFYSELPNISFQSNQLSYLLSSVDLIYIELESYDSKHYTGGTIDYIKEGQFKVGIYNPSYFSLSNLYISHCYVQEDLLHLKNLVNLQIDTLSIHNSLENSTPLTYCELIQDFVYKYFILQDSYITGLFNSEFYSESLSHFGHLCHLKNIGGVRINNLKSSNNTSSKGGTDFLIDSSIEELNLQNILISNNTAYSNIVGSGLSVLNSKNSLKLSELNFRNNKNIIGYGALYLTTLEINSVYISDSFFKDNSAAYGGAISVNAAEFTLEKVEFYSNSVTGFYGGAVYYIPESSIINQSFTLKDSVFSANQVLTGDGGAIAINDPINSEETLVKIVMEGNTFLDNTSQIDSSILHVSNTVRLSRDSQIRSCIFKGNSSLRNSNIYLGYIKGILTFDECEFEQNTSNQGIVLCISTFDNTDITPTKVVIKNSIFYKNVSIDVMGGSVLHISDNNYFSCLETHSNTFTYNQASLFYINRGYLQDTNSTFSYNTAYQSSVIQVFNQGIVLLSSPGIFDNSSQNSGGVMIIGSKSTVMIKEGIIMRNRSELDGGVIFMEHSSIINIDTSYISENQSGRKGSILYSIGCEADGSYISDSNLLNNTSEAGGSIFLVSSVLNISNSEISHNRDKEITPGILLAYSTLNLNSTRFREQTASMGTAIYTTSESKVSIDHCTFENLKASKLGGAILAYNSALTIVSSTFSKLHAESAGAILAYTNCTLEIFSSDFTAITSESKGSIIKSFDSKLSLSGSNFADFSPTAIEGIKLEMLKVYTSSFKNGSGDTGGAILCETCKLLDVRNSVFSNLTASSGGAIHITTDLEASSERSCIIYNSTFMNNTAYRGGALYASNLNLDIFNNTFQYNSAITNSKGEEGNGGCIDIECPDLTGCSFNITSNYFTQNSADQSGGGFIWRDFIPYRNHNTFSNNTAIYGENEASFAVSLVLLNASNQVVEMPSIYQRNAIGYIPTLMAFNDIAPGQNGPELRVGLVDIHGKIVKSDNSSTVELISDSQTLLLSGEIKSQANNGTFIFIDYQIIGPPGSNVTLVVGTSNEISFKNLRESHITMYNQFKIDLQLRDCLIGEKKTDNKCTPCPSETYSIDPEEGRCYACPDTASCYGMHHMVPKPGYWRPSLYTDKFFVCLNEDACIGSPVPPNYSYTGLCEEGYKGNLCQTCDRNYSEMIKNNCMKCPSPVKNVVFVIGMMLVFIVVCVIMVKSNMKSAHKPKSIFSIYIKILLIIYS